MPGQSVLLGVLRSQFPQGFGTPLVSNDGNNIPPEPVVLANSQSSNWTSSRCHSVPYRTTISPPTKYHLTGEIPSLAPVCLSFSRFNCYSAQINRPAGSGVYTMCVCGINCIIQLHPTRMGYASCLIFPPLAPPRSCPHPAFFRKSMPSPVVRGSIPISFYPSPRNKNNK